MTFQSIPINTIKLIPINNQKTVVSSSFLMPNLIIINTKILAPTNIQKKLLVSLYQTQNYYRYRFLHIPKSYTKINVESVHEFR